jgi:hypothetical protein
MNENSNIARLRQQGESDDPLTHLLRSGARQLLVQAVETEAAAFLAQTPLVLLDQSGSHLPGKPLRNDIFFHPSIDVRDVPLDRRLGKAKSIKTAYADAAGSKRLKRGSRPSQ